MICKNYQFSIFLFVQCKYAFLLLFDILSDAQQGKYIIAINIYKFAKQKKILPRTYKFFLSRQIWLQAKKAILRTELQNATLITYWNSLAGVNQVVRKKRIADTPLQHYSNILTAD